MGVPRLRAQVWVGGSRVWPSHLCPILTPSAPHATATDFSRLRPLSPSRPGGQDDAVKMSGTASHHPENKMKPLLWPRPACLSPPPRPSPSQGGRLVPSLHWCPLQGTS